MRRWNEYHGTLNVAGTTPTTFGPLSHLRAGMLSYLEASAVPGVFPLTADEIGGSAIILVSQRNAEWAALAGHLVEIVEDPKGRFFTLLDVAAFDASAFPDLPDAAFRTEHPTIGIRPFFVIVDRGVRKLVQPAGWVSIGKGCSFGRSTTVQRGIFGEWTEIGDEVFVDSHVHIGHGAILGDRVTIAAGAVLAGFVTLGADAWIGINTSVRQFVSIGEGSFVGAGAVVLDDVAPWDVVVGNPAKVRGWRCPDCFRVIMERPKGRCPCRDLVWP